MGIEEEQAKRDLEIEKMRFEFAWRHFEFHARQRTTMFHFFIIIMPVLLGGYFYLLRPDALNLQMALIVAVIGFVLTLTFTLLDVRNRQLYRFGQNALALLEGQMLYAPGFKPLKTSGGTEYRGIITEEILSHKATPVRSYVVRHAFLVSFIYAIAALLFASLAVQTYCRLPG